MMQAKMSLAMNPARCGLKEEEMTTALAFEMNAFSVPHFVEALVRRLAVLRAQRAKRLATLPLLELDRAQLEDLAASRGA